MALVKALRGIEEIGFMMQCDSSTVPSGWLVCNGALIEKAVYPELYTLLGSTFGTPTSTHFYLPNVIDRFIVKSYTAGGFPLAWTGGANTHTLTSGEMPSHNHSGNSDYMNANASHDHGITVVAGSYHDHSIGVAYGGSGGNQGIEYIAAGSNNIVWAGYGGTHSHANTTSTSTNVDHSHTMIAQGNGAAHENRQPFRNSVVIIKAVA